ncbi:hypothetical protein [uncultured Phenylobacterium sp.]|uniref:hypothetical protein n=1 Tax=uncultured Phenylobacterium sp. TaxID=349273 RepID=UPI0025FACEDD|nr:hypothetical protein [uncultured Phenylobacterium sp.]
MNVVVKFWKGARTARAFMRAQALLVQGRIEDAWKVLANLQIYTETLPPQNEVRIEVDMFSSHAWRLGDWNLSLFHAKAAVAGLRHEASRIAPATRDHMLCYCRILIESASWQLGGPPHDAGQITGVALADVRPEQVPKGIALRFPISPVAA